MSDNELCLQEIGKRITDRRKKLGLTQEALAEKGVKERREQQITERNEGRADERGTSTEANAVVKDAGKADRKQVQQKQAVVGKDKKLSIHERLEINKRIIQEKQGKDKPERGADRGVR